MATSYHQKNESRASLQHSQANWGAWYNRPMNSPTNMPPRKHHADERIIRLRDVKPYSIPRSLNDLNGPRTGVLHLPKSIYWAPGGGDITLSTEGSTKLAYQSVIAEGTIDQQCRFLNKDLLIELWPHLSIPSRAAHEWQERFPQLRGNIRAEFQSC